MGTAIESVYLPPNRVTCVPCYESILVAALNDPAINPVTVTINGVSYVSGSNLTLTVRGTSICWTGVLDLSAAGLANNTRYSWTVSQGSNSDSGSYYHTPARYTNHRLLFGSCDVNTTFSSEVSGIYPQFKAMYDAGKEISGFVMTDDDGYVDSCSITDDGTGSYNYPPMSGLATGGQPQVVQTEDAYLIAWCAMLGMLGPDKIDFTADELSNKDLKKVLWAREENRSFCRKTFNRLSNSASDHNTIDDMGWDLEPATFVGYAPSVAAFNAFYGQTLPDISSLITKTDLNASHWVCKFGDICLGSLDYITNSARTWGSGVTYGDSTQISQFTSLLGSAQIDDYLNAVDAADLPFTIMATQYSIRYLIARTGTVAPMAFTSTVSERGNGAQHPLYDHCIADYARLYTESGNVAKSIMYNPKTNGTTGVFAMVGGDLHLAQAISCNHPAYAGNLAENFWHINIATVNNSGMAGSVGLTGDLVAETKLEFAEVANTYDEYYGFYIDCFGLEAPPRMEHVFFNKAGDTILHKQFVVGRTGNYGQEMTVSVTNKTRGASGSYD